MSSFFEAAYLDVMKHEGGYANDPDDKGGETYCGISRKHHPEWNGWQHIDSIKLQRGPIKNNTIFSVLSPYVKEFYKINYWNKIMGDAISDYGLARDMFDAAVNCGYVPAILWLQRLLNVMNNRGKYWPDLKVDGIIGPKTIQTLTKANLMGNAAMIHNVFNVLKGYYYLEIMEKNETQEKWARSWFKRLHFTVT